MSLGSASCTSGEAGRVDCSVLRGMKVQQAVGTRGRPRLGMAPDRRGWTRLPAVPRRKPQPHETMSPIGLILLVILLLILIGALPTWGYSRSWGYAPSGLLGLLLIILVILLIMGIL